MRPRIAKLTRPRVARAIARERLSAQLDEARALRRAILVSGPPGAGKTTLVARWLDDRRIGGIWFQIDPGDAALPTFFHYLGLAAGAFARGRARPLPALTPEYLPDVEGFSRRCFRDLFARMRPGSALVLDNHQDIPADQLFHALIASALEEVPAGMNVILISRRELPESYARAVANEHVGVLDWPALRLTLPEARAIGEARGICDAGIVEALRARSVGWAAGLSLLLERARHGLQPASLEAPDAMRDVFGYFAGQIFDRAPGQVQRLLLELSFLPRMTAAAAREQTGDAAAVQMLDDLHRRNLFTDRRLTREPVYQFHALFRSFLAHRATQVLSESRRIELTRRAARSLERAGELDEAMALYLLAGAHVPARELVLRESARLVEQGRWQVVQAWIDALPEQVVACDCWLLLWRGTARACVAPAEGRRWLEASFASAASGADTVCRLEAAAAIVQTYVSEYASFWPLDRWIDAMQEALAWQPRFASEESRTSTSSSAGPTT